MSLSLRSSRNCRWGEWMYSALFTLNTTTEVSLSKTPNPQLLPGRRSINDCPLLRVCVHGVCVCVCSLLCVCTLDGLNAEHKFRVWVTILGHMSLHFTSLIKMTSIYNWTDNYYILDGSIFFTFFFCVWKMLQYRLTGSRNCHLNKSENFTD